MQFETVIFDFNGTLLWDTWLHNQAWDRFLEKYDKQMTDAEKTKKIQGKTNQLILQGIFGEMSQSKIQELSLDKEGIYQQLCIESGIELAPGAQKLWEELQRRKVKFTIATSAGRENVDFYFQRYHLERWFDYEAVVFNDGNLASKPDPQIFNIAIRRLKANPATTVIFEDSIAGIKAAAAANPGKVIIVNSEQQNYESFSFQIITHFDQVDCTIFSQACSEAGMKLGGVKL